MRVYLTDVEARLCLEALQHVARRAEGEAGTVPQGYPTAVWASKQMAIEMRRLADKFKVV